MMLRWTMLLLAGGLVGATVAEADENPALFEMAQKLRGALR